MSHGRKTEYLGSGLVSKQEIEVREEIVEKPKQLLVEDAITFAGQEKE